LVGLWRIGGEQYFYVLVLWSIFLTSFAVFSLAFSICRVFQVHNLIALACALWALGAFLVVAGGGMEVILAVPLSLLTIRYLLSSRFAWEPRQCLTYGFLISLTILARLDTVLLLLIGPGNFGPVEMLVFGKI